jgi:3'-5' exoribonuclease
MKRASLQDWKDGTTGWGFFLCVQKERRTGRGGDFLALVLQDATGRIQARVFDEVDRFDPEFDAGEFVKVQGRARTYNGRLEIAIATIRRVHPDSDRPDGFAEEQCVPSAPRPVDEMWEELQELLANVTSPHVAKLLSWVVSREAERLRIWPAAVTVHHAYRGGLLEHILQVARSVTSLADVYGANRDLLVAGAVLHDIGKLDELSGGAAVEYTRAGNLVGHIALGIALVHQAAGAIEGFPDALRDEIAHLVASHHGSRELGSPVEPVTVEAFILAMADDLDAKIHQVRRHLEDTTGPGAFTPYHQRLRRSLYRGTPS